MSTNSPQLSSIEAESAGDVALAARVTKVLSSLEPVFRREGGRARLLNIRNLVAHVELSSDMCEGCNSALAGMEGGLRLMLLERVPDLKEVIFE